MKNGKKRVIVIGIDGASWDIIQTGISQGLLPIFDYLIDNSGRGNLTSVMPPISPSAWNTIYTGTHPGKTGIFNFFDFDKESYSYKPLLTKNRKVPTIFPVLSAYSKRCLAVNLPFYYPPEPMSGLVIPGFGSPKVQVFPKEFEDVVKSLIPDFRGDIGDEDVILNRNKVQLKCKVERIFTETQELIRYFFRNDYDLGFFVFRAHEPLKHFYFDDSNLILHFYSYIDKVLKNILNQISTRDTLLIVSDHGFRKVRAYIRVNNLLGSIGLFECKQKKQVAVLEAMGKTLLRISPKLVRMILSNPFAWRLLKKLPNKSISYLNDVVWTNTKAFYLEGSGGIIRMNLEGRESKGKVPRREYETTRNVIISKLKSLRSPDGGKVIKDIIPIEKVYGVNSKRYGDLIVITERDYVPRGGYSPNGGVFDYERGRERPGEHDINGIFVIYSKDQRLIEKMKKTASVVDVAPTILSILEVPIPDYMDGKPLSKLEYNRTSSEKLKISLRIKKLKDSGNL